MGNREDKIEIADGMLVPLTRFAVANCVEKCGSDQLCGVTRNYVVTKALLNQ